MGFGVWGLRFAVWGLRFGVCGLVFPEPSESPAPPPRSQAERVAAPAQEAALAHTWLVPTPTDFESDGVQELSVVSLIWQRNSNPTTG